MSNTDEIEIKTSPSSDNVYVKLIDEYGRKLRLSAPNALTLGNLACGLFSLIMAMNGLHRFSALFIFIAAACDFFDGRVARMLGLTTKIGAQLDSLADVVSFGVAPTILAYSISQCLAGAWRLARFNVNPTEGHFIGLPIPAAGLTVAFLAIFSYVSPLIMIALAALMVSKIDVPKF
ncbi:hypothetical protein I4U23_021521 [Adineta vaga]|nr:hypothetical protein I4U23_021521 [Adineta vaga]